MKEAPSVLIMLNLNTLNAMLIVRSESRFLVDEIIRNLKNYESF